MIVPHLLFAHMLGDYVLQTNWLVARKGKSWYGLVLHGGIVGVMSLLALSPYLADVWWLVLLLTAFHTLQDAVKVRYGPRLGVHPFIPYMADQLGHYLLIGVLQAVISGLYSLDPPPTEVAYMWTGAAVLAVTRFYDVTWWANWLDMIPYMNRWRAMGYAERLSIVILTAAGMWFVAPLATLPRLAESYRDGRPVWRARRGPLEVSVGIVFSIAVGLALRRVYTQI